MKKLLVIATMIAGITALGGCEHYQERKSPCPPSASSAHSNPCNPLPINVASALTLNHDDQT